MKIILLITIFLVTSITAQCQVGLAFKAGGTAATVAFGRAYMDEISDEYQAGVQPRAGFSVGAGLDIPFGKTLSLQPEILYVRKGYDLRSRADLLTVNATMNHLEVPILLKTTLDKKNWRYFAYAGPHLNYFLGGRYFFQNNTFPSTGSGSIVLGNRLNIGATAGIGISRHWGLGDLSAEVRYAHDLTNFNETRKTQHRTASILVGYVLPLTRQDSKPGKR